MDLRTKSSHTESTGDFDCSSPYVLLSTKKGRKTVVTKVGSSESGSWVVSLYMGVTVSSDLVAEVPPCKVGTACRHLCEEPMIAGRTPISLESKGKNPVTTIYVGGLGATSIDVPSKGGSNALKSEGLAVEESKGKSPFGVVAGNFTDTSVMGMLEYSCSRSEHREEKPDNTDVATVTPGILGSAITPETHDASYEKTSYRKKLTPLTSFLTNMVGVEAVVPSVKGYANPVDEAISGMVSLWTTNVLWFVNNETESPGADAFCTCWTTDLTFVDGHTVLYHA